MKKLLSGITVVASVLTLSACTTKKITTTPSSGDESIDKTPLIDSGNLNVKNEANLPLTTGYQFNVKPFNYLKTTNAQNAELFADLVDGLVEIDRFDRYVPALAESIPTPTTNSQGNQEWKFTLKDNLYWQQANNGARYAKVTAKDFVAAAQYILNPSENNGTASIYSDFIVGAEEYLCAKTAQSAKEKGGSEPSCAANYSSKDLADNLNFSKVGVKALNDKDVLFTVKGQKDYFVSALTYNAFFPVNEQYLLSRFNNFGDDSSNILVNGAYLITEEKKERIVKVKNPIYWDAENVLYDRINLKAMNTDTTTVASLETMFNTGELSQFTLVNSTANASLWRKYVTGNTSAGSFLNPVNNYTTPVETSSRFTWMSMFNFNRDYSKSDSTTAKASNARQSSTEAIQDADFRRAMTFALNKKYRGLQNNASNVNESNRQLLTPTGVAQDSSGKDYVEYYYDVYAEKQGISRQEAENRLKDGGTSMYNESYAIEQFKKAQATHGWTQQDKPIIQILGNSGATAATIYNSLVGDLNRLAKEAGCNVEFRAILPADTAKYTALLDNGDYDFSYAVHGWAGDYGDPMSYLNTFKTNGNMVKYTGLNRSNKLEAVLGGYTNTLKTIENTKYSSSTDSARLRALAEAEYQLLVEDALTVAQFVDRSERVTISNFEPYTRTTKDFGHSILKLKFNQPRVDANIKVADLRTKFLNDKEAARAKYSWLA